MSDAELDSKVRELAAYGVPFFDAAGLIAAVRASKARPYDPVTSRKLTFSAALSSLSSRLVPFDPTPC